MDPAADTAAHLAPPDLLALNQDERYRAAAAAFGRDVARFVAGYERDPERRKELLQDVHLALWRSLAAFRGQCSLRTWVYRVAHNTCAGHVDKSVKRVEHDLATLDAAEDTVDEAADIAATDRRIDLTRVVALIHTLPATDRQLMLLYLEDLDAAAIADVTGLSMRNVATRIHRLKALLAARLRQRSP